MGVKVETIGTYRLLLHSGILLDLPNTCYVPNFSRNLISLSRLDLDGYKFQFGDQTFSMSKNNSFVSGGFLVDGLYKINLDPIFFTIPFLAYEC